MIYANDNDTEACHWMSCLPVPIDRIDDRSIKEVNADDLRDYHQCHFFAGIGGWPYALQLAGWPADVPVWTGSCPCQPFSSAGKRGGVNDERHLWPEFLRLIAECNPPIIFGEQVASKNGRKWLAGVRADLEAMGYGVGAADLCAASVGAPHIRQRLFWVAYAASKGSLSGSPSRIHRKKEGRGAWDGEPERRGADHRLGNTGSKGPQERVGYGNVQRATGQPPSRKALELSSDVSRVGNTDSQRFSRRSEPNGKAIEPEQQASRRSNVVRSGADSFWGHADYLYCSDGKYRPVEPGTFPLAHGVPGRVAQLRGLGNAIVPQIAAEFVGVFMDFMGSVIHGTEPG